MLRAGAEHAPRQDLAALGRERPQQLDVLVVDVVDLVRAELADLAAPEEVALALLLAAAPRGAGAAGAARAASRLATETTARSAGPEGWSATHLSNPPRPAGRPEPGPCAAGAWPPRPFARPCWPPPCAAPRPRAP